MKTLMSYSYNPISCVSDASNDTSCATRPLGLIGHLRAAIVAWRGERQVRKANKAVLANGSKAKRKLSDLSAAELYQARFDCGDRFAQSSFPHGGFTLTSDVLSGMVLAWPKPSDKQR